MARGVDLGMCLVVVKKKRRITYQTPTPRGSFFNSH